MPRPRATVRPAPSWLLVGSLLAAFLVVLVVCGLTAGKIGNDAVGAHEAVSSDQVPEDILTGGPIIDGQHDPVRSTSIPKGTVVLTFDDGPDPTWTPQVLSILRKHNVPGTFFVVGSMASRYPELVKEIHDSGGELGVHSFSHPDLGTSPAWRVEREMAEAQLVIQGATGTSSYLMRPPYSSSAGALDNIDYQTVKRVGAMGYLTVLTDVDGEDWKRPGVDQIVRNATPKDGTGGTILLHDSGGDRTQTIAALDKLIPQLQASGYTFKTVEQAMNLPPAPAASSTDVMFGKLLLGVIGAAWWISDAARWLLAGVAALVILRLVLMLIAARRHDKRRRDPDWAWGPTYTQPVSVIVPAYNESKNIEATVRSILANDHPLEVIVVDDGSSDGTAELVESLNLPNVRVIRQLNAGKPAALNTGTANARYEVVVMMDGDTVFEPDTVRHLAQPFADPRVGAVAGNVKVANTDTLIGRLQHVEYVVGFGIDRRVQDTTSSITTIPGAAGAFRKEALREVGGLSDDTLAEDTDLTIALGRSGWKVVFEERALAWTEAPATAGQLWRQRYRWSYGTMQAIWKHRRAVREPGSFGWLGLAHVMLFQIMLPLSAPLVDIFLLYGLLFEDPATTLLLWTLMMGLQVTGGIYAFHVDGEPKGALWVLPVQQFVYRQLMYVVLVQSVVSAISGVRVRWQKLKRTGAVDALLSPQASPAPVPPPGTAERHPSFPSMPAVAGPAPTAVAPVPRAADDPGSPLPAPVARPRGRERWLDSLRGLALVRVVVYHALGLGWLSIAFPSMGVMFALGGSLMVQSMRKTPAIDVIGQRIRRLLPPLWLMAVVLVPLMVWQGWGSEGADAGTAGNGVPWSDLVFWVFPIMDPPGSEWGFDTVEVLWYLRAYLWFVLLTPVMLAAFRKRPVISVLVPLVLVVGDGLLGSPLSGASGLGAGLLDFVTFGACWMLGFAHREGMIRKLPLPALLGLAAAGIAAGMFWAVGHPSAEAGLDLNEIPMAQALVSAGFVLLALRVNPAMGWVDKVPGLGRLISVVNARAITIYLLNNPAIDIAAWANDKLGLPDSNGWLILSAVVVVLIGVACFGWVEDLAARRPLQILPGGKRAAAARRKKADEAVPQGPVLRPRTLAEATARRIAELPATEVLPVVPKQGARQQGVPQQGAPQQGAPAPVPSGVRVADPGATRMDTVPGPRRPAPRGWDAGPQEWPGGPQDRPQDSLRPRRGNPQPRTRAQEWPPPQRRS
ncbi:glycosyltransferase [Pseudonocardia sp. RS11V-5]|uniref:glycosyltransferase n=1 Tax=Pseudonocardia terrae TaxID=2905831 RepID=UPI001E573C9F|nr:glycosyltransferase [Pseudonocardia terrae]MCE3552797.1 glycosyltransferase [Pseudonocardia terrae]